MIHFQSPVTLHNDTMVKPADFHIVFFCMGNICRSPTAHGVFRHHLQRAGLQDRVSVDSAGTHNYHPGKPPDLRSQTHAKARGYDLSDLQARQLVDRDFAQADLLLAMDWDNLALAEAMAPPLHRRKLRRLTEFCRVHQSPVVPDPYLGNEHDFQHVLDLVEDACEGLLLHVQACLATRDASRSTS